MALSLALSYSRPGNALSSNCVCMCRQVLHMRPARRDGCVHATGKALEAQNAADQSTCCDGSSCTVPFAAADSCRALGNSQRSSWPSFMQSPGKVAADQRGRDLTAMTGLSPFRCFRFRKRTPALVVVDMPLYAASPPSSAWGPAAGAVCGVTEETGASVHARCGDL